MNNGGVENVKENGSSKNNNHKKLVLGSRSDEFVNSVTRVAVAQICESIGFQGFQSSALAALFDIAVRYVRDIGKCSSSSANLAGRSECNVFDVVHGLEGLNSNQGFSDGSNVHRCLLGSGAVKEVVRFVGETEEIPFAYAVPEFPVVRKRKLNSSFVEKGEDPPEGYIPGWLPVFPDPENLVEKQSVCEKGGDVEVKLKNEVHEVSSMERPILSLQHRWACNGSDSMLANEVGGGSKVVESNPFFAPPLPFEEKEVSKVIFPTKLLEEGEVRYQNGNHLSALDTFALAAEAVESRAFQYEEEVQNVASNGNPRIRLRLRRHKKYPFKAIKIQNKDTEKITYWFNSDSEEDEKKMKAEEMDGIENQQELDHL